ncbi:MAG: sugar ABC transporter ATP-binding protein [Lentisphaerae bacterium]|nr:sugar ABC transporter ATP-binding protein [Lentisphaerota bacterium]
MNETATASGYALEINGVEKSYGNVRVLNGIDFSLQKNRIAGLVGGNGAGKSTLAKCIAGYLDFEKGSIRCDASIVMIPQEFMLIPEMKVYENLFLGSEIHKYGFADKKEMIRQASEALDKLEADIDPEARVENLGVAKRQMVELAKSIIFPSSVLIMDEPTTVLDRDETDVLFNLLKRYRDSGGSVIYITHRLYEHAELCDDICVMRDGDIVFYGAANTVTPHKVAQLMVGKNLDALFPEKIQTTSDAPVLLEIDDISSGEVIRNISFKLKKGEILGLTGLAGSGRTELAETICGIRAKTSGSIIIDGESHAIRSMYDAHKAGLSYLSEDRQGTALLLDDSVEKNTVLSSLSQYSVHGIINFIKCETAAGQYVSDFNIATRGIDSPVRTLSGGNQQKVAIAKELNTGPRIFIFDEPTRGVDVGARSEIYNVIHTLASEDMACILISSDLEEITGNCSRALVMRGGELAGELEGKLLKEDEIMYLATGIK